MKKIKIFGVLTYILIIFSYLEVVLFEYSSIINALMAIIGVLLGTLWIARVYKKINLNKLILLYLSIIIIIITQKLNLISLYLLILLSILADKESIEISINRYLVVSIMCFCIVATSYYFFDLNKACDTSIWRVTNQTTYQRVCLGFEHPNQTMLKWLAISMAMLGKCNKKNIVRYSIFIIILTTILYKYTLSRTALISILLLIGLLNIFKKKLDRKVGDKIKIFLGICPIIFSAISFISIYLDRFKYIDLLFSGRFTLFRMYFYQYGIKLLGNNYVESNTMLDNSYLHIFLSKGVIFAVSYFLIIYLIIKEANNLTVSNCIVILCYFICAFTETILFKFDLIVLIISLIYSKGGFMEDKYEQ